MRTKKGSPQPKEQVWRSTQALSILILLIAVVAVYANSLRNEFLFDDLETIVRLQTAGGSGPFGQLVKLITRGVAYRPVRSASYAFDYALSGLNPVGYHVGNIAYHALSALFVFLIAEIICGRGRIALFVALLFALHPIQTDAVTYLSGRRDVLSGLFVLAGFYTFLRYRALGSNRFLGLTVLLYLLAFFTKESGIVLPLLCFAYDLVSRMPLTRPTWALPPFGAIWTAARSAFRDGRRLYLPLAAMAGGLVVYVLFFVRGTWVRAYHGGSLWFTILTMARVTLHYLSLLVAPVTLNADYSYNGFPVTTSWTDLRAWMAILILVALGSMILSCLRSRPVVAFGGMWFFLSLLPVSQIVPHHEMMAEHYLYVATAGYALALGGLLKPWLEHQPAARALQVGSVVLLLLLGLRTVWRNRDWKDDVTLWSKTVQTAPQVARARNNLGVAYLRRGELTRSELELEAAVQIKPDLAIAHGNLGKIYLDRGELERAERELQSAIRLKENEVIPRLWLGAVFLRQERLPEAEQQFRAALARPPYDAYAYNNLGILFAKNGRMVEAESAFQAALTRMPDLIEARQNLARLRRLQGSSEPVAQPAVGAVP